MIVSIDPGIRGAIAFFGPGDRISVHDMPIRLKQTVSKVKNELDPIALNRLLLERVPPSEKGLVVMETMHAFMGGGEERKGSMASQASLAATKAVICAICELNRLDIAYVTPKAWQAFYGIRKTPSEDTKKQSLRLARELFGNEFCPLAKHDGRADALLIGRYGKRNLT